MDAIQQSGATTIRLELNPAVARSDNWSSYITTFRLASERGLLVLPYFGGNLAGAFSLPQSSEWAGYEQFVYEAVHKFGYGCDACNGDQAQAWEIWNEPNLGSHNPGGVAQPHVYGQFLKRMSAAVIQAQSERSSHPTEVLFGGLISVASAGGNLNVKQFLDQADEIAGVPASYKGLSLHPYSFSSGLAGLETNVNFARGALNSAPGGATKELWITELGWPVEYGTAAQPAVSPQEQAGLLTQTFNWMRANSAALKINSAFWYFYRDTADANWAYHCGLRTAAGEYRPAWYAFESQAGAPPWPFVFSPHNLGGNTSDHPGISSWAPNRLDVFMRGGNGALEHRYYENGNWFAWEGMPGGANISYGPSAVSWASSRVDVVADSEGSVKHWYWVPSVGWASDNLGGTPTSDTGISSWGTGRLDVFVRGSAGTLSHRYYDGGKWWPWETMGGPQLSAGASAVSWSPGRIDVVAATTANTVEHWYWEASFGWARDSLGGEIATTPGIASWGPNRLDVFGKTVSGSLVHKWYAPSRGWSPWEATGYQSSTGPAAVSWEVKRLDVVDGTPGDGSLGHQYWNIGW